MDIYIYKIHHLKKETKNLNSVQRGELSKKKALLYGID